MGIENVRLDEKIALVHSDERRDIYDPSEILTGLEDGAPWYAHNVLVLNTDGLRLGNHYHDYEEVFFTPTGGFKFKMVDIDAPKQRNTFYLSRGSRIYLPRRIAHVALGSRDAVLLGFGNVEFNPERLIPYEVDF